MKNLFFSFFFVFWELKYLYDEIKKKVNKEYISQFQFLKDALVIANAKATEEIHFNNYTGEEI